MQSKNRISLSRIISYAGIASALGVLFHSFPLFLPAIGLLLSPLGTLPILIATLFSPLCGVSTWLCTTAILMFLSPQEAAIFFCTTGCLGFIVGLTYRGGFVKAILYSAGMLFLGIITLIYLLGVPAFGDHAGQLPTALFLPAVMLFSLLYSFLWVLITKHLVVRMMKLIS